MLKKCQLLRCVEERWKRTVKIHIPYSTEIQYREYTMQMVTDNSLIITGISVTDHLVVCICTVPVRYTHYKSVVTYKLQERCVCVCC